MAAQTTAVRHSVRALRPITAWPDICCTTELRLRSEILRGTPVHDSRTHQWCSERAGRHRRPNDTKSRAYSSCRAPSHRTHAPRHHRSNHHGGITTTTGHTTMSLAQRVSSPLGLEWVRTHCSHLCLSAMSLNTSPRVRRATYRTLELLSRAQLSLEDLPPTLRTDWESEPESSGQACRGRPTLNVRPHHTVLVRGADRVVIGPLLDSQYSLDPWVSWRDGVDITSRRSTRICSDPSLWPTGRCGQWRKSVSRSPHHECRC